MRIVTTAIPDGSHEVRAYFNLPDKASLPADKRPFDFACNLLRIDDETCELARAVGRANLKLLYRIGEKAAELGYKKMQFCRADRQKSSRWGKWIGNRDGLNYFEIDIEEKLNE